MAQAAQIIPFPSNKLTFKAMKIDLKKILTAYDRKRAYVAVAVKFLEMSPKKMRASVLAMEKKISAEAVPSMIADLESLSKDFIAMGELVDTAAARLTAGHRNLI